MIAWPEWRRPVPTQRLQIECERTLKPHWRFERLHCGPAGTIRAHVGVAQDGRAPATQAGGRGFDSHRPLQSHRLDTRSARRDTPLGSRKRGCNSVGRVSASQAECRGFESHHPLPHKPYGINENGQSTRLVDRRFSARCYAFATKWVHERVILSTDGTSSTSLQSRRKDST